MTNLSKVAHRLPFMRAVLYTVACSVLAFPLSGSAEGDILPAVADDAQAMSLSGTLLRSPPADADTLARLRAAKNEYDSDPADVGKLIWYARRLAYAGDFREAIRIYSRGIERHPDDARLYRHRGHRYISIREFDRAIRDLEHAAELIEGSEDEVEPDGLPNALNIPVSTLHTNIWYHLGLARYLQQDWDNAWRAFQAGYEAGRNDDNAVSATHWRYMILRRRGESADQAAHVLAAIDRDMNVIENEVYRRLCLFYKGEITLDDMLADEAAGATGAAAEYGVANWLRYSGRETEALRKLEVLAASEDWAAFGVIAAEADLAAR